MPRNRTVRLAVLGSSVQRAAPSGFPSSRSSAVKRRIIVGFLVLLSLSGLGLLFYLRKLRLSALAVMTAGAALVILLATMAT